MTSQTQRMFEHMAWADRRVIGLLQTSPEARAVSRVLLLLSHLVAAERVWLLRIRGEDTSGHPIWPEWTLEELASAADGTARGYRELVAALSDAEGERIVEYRNSQGVPFRTPLADILTHVALHGSYHRGQAAAALRAGGAEPVNTDYITYVRD